MDLNDPSSLEDKHVTQVYECIAQHFSNTRHKPWPIVESWLKDLPSGSLVADIGCGNGKYLNLHSHYHIIGLDKSIGLTNISNSRGHEVAVADSLDLPFVNHKFDYCISIAVIHHFSNRSRRIEALKEIKRILAPGGHALIFVWALEQSRSFESQDVFVPWKLNNDPKNVYQRYYHLFSSGELEELMTETGFKIIKSGYDADNWWVVGESPIETIE